MRLFLLGHPVNHSISPAIHNAALRSIDLPPCYEALDVLPGEVAHALTMLRQPDVLGANVTVPHKQAVLPYLDDVDPLVERVGAANTITTRSGRLVGYNTDVGGFVSSLREDGVAIAEAGVVLLGAGGAARAIAYALAAERAAWLAIFNRSEQRARNLARELDERTGLDATGYGLEVDGLRARLQRADLVVNSTTVGMHADESLVPTGSIRRDSVVCDIIYNPAETALLRQARAAGAHTIGGLGMLVHQAAAAFTLWTARPAPHDVMLQAAEQALAPRGIR